MKKLWKWILILGAPLFILTFLLIIPVIIMNGSWWWFFGPLIFFIFVGIIIGVILLVIKLNKPKPQQIKISIKDAKSKAIHDMKYDKDNPDNFWIKWHQTLKIGEKGSDMTPIAIFHGVGTELNKNRVVIVNLNNPKETTFLVDPSDTLLLESIAKIADYPPEEIQEEITTRQGAYGFPEVVRKIRRPSSLQQKSEKEKKEIEEKNAM